MAFVVSRNDWICRKTIIFWELQNETSLHNEKTGISYTLQGDYYLADRLPTPKYNGISAYGSGGTYRNLKQCRKVLYISLLISGRRNCYLTEMDKQSKDLFFQMVT